MGACGSANADEGTLTFLGNNNQNAYQGLLDGFEKKYPDVKVKFSTVTGAQSGYQETLQTRISGGKLPDVYILPPEQLSDVVKSNLAKDLSDESFMKDIGQTSRDMYSQGGKVYGMSVSGWVRALCFNKDLLAKAGYDNIPATWDEFKEMCKKLKAAGVTPYLEASDTIGVPIPAWIAQASAENVKNGKKTIDQAIADGDTTFEKAYTPYYAKWDELFKEGILNSDVSGLSAESVVSEFTSGRLAIMPSGSWDIPTLSKTGINFEYGTIPMLKKGDTPYAEGSPDPAYAINAKLSGKKLENAEKFLAYVASPEGLKAIQDGLGLATATESYSAKVDPTFQNVYDTYIKTGHFYMQFLAEGAMRPEGYTQMQQLALGSITPEQAGKNMDEKYATLR
ncbi:ABC transporter substrate-binding protein [Bifidobacterium aerophilum]|nr:extracellular solute-binding protein [Bifidobacterium aerophilum]